MIEVKKPRKLLRVFQLISISSMSGYTSSVSRGEYCIPEAGVTIITKILPIDLLNIILR